MGKHDGRPWPGPQRHNQRETRRIGGTHRPRKGCLSGFALLAGIGGLAAYGITEAIRVLI